MQFSRRVVFVDTNIFLHYPALDDPRWATLLKAEAVEFNIVPTVLSELNKHKDSGRTKAIRKRAAKAVASLSKALDGDLPYAISKTASLNFAVREYADYEARNLDPLCQDDRLLLSALHTKEESGDESVCILAHDLALKAKCKFHKMECIQPDEALKLPPELDEEEQELQRLRAQLATRPVLSLSFENSATFIVKECPPPPPSDYGSAMNITRKICEKHNLKGVLPQAYPHSSEHECRGYTRYAHEFPEEHAKEVMKWLDYQQLMSRTISLQLYLRNGGTSPATRSRVWFPIPEGAVLLEEIEPEVPFPRPPKSFGDWVQDRYTGLRTLDEYGRFIPHISRAAENAMCEPYVDSKNGVIEIRYSRFDVQQGETDELPTIHLRFADYSEMKGFKLACKMIANEIPAPFEQELNVDVRTSKHSVAHLHPKLAGML